VAILLVVIAGLATAAGLVLVNRSDDRAGDVDGTVVFTDAPSTTPVFEPRDARGNDPFFPLETQLAAYRKAAQDQLDERADVAQANAEPGETVQRQQFDVAALDEAVKTGLYGGTEENTCDPERLISFLYANPDIGEAWAKVQGIQFVQIADYIRSLDVRVLAEPVNVLNHGYDPSTGAAYEIDTVLDAGTAVLVDENGDVRARCYCGNPIRPKPPQHMPPRCLVFGAFVYTQPGGSTKRDGAPSDVVLTGREATASGAYWTEVKWGAGDDQTGWVLTDNLRKHYCPTPTSDRFCPGPDATEVWHTPDTTDHVGQVTGKVRTADTTLDIFAPINPVGGIGGETIVDGFMLIRFKEAAPSVQNSAWVQLSDLNQDSSECMRIRQCVDTEGPVWDRAGGGILDGGGVQWVEFTGHFIGDPLVTHAEVRVNDGSGAYGWISNFYTPLPDQDCDVPVYDCIEKAWLYERPDQMHPAFLGQLTNIDVTIIGGPDNGRVEVMVGPGGPTGWVDANEFYDGHNDCRPVPACYRTTVPAWTEFSTSGASIPPIGTPTILRSNGAIVKDAGSSFRYMNIGGTDYWIDAGGLLPLPIADCTPDDAPDCDNVPSNPGAESAPDPRSPETYDPTTGYWGEPDAQALKIPNFDVCCVDALFNTRMVGNPSADSVPRDVVVIGSSIVDGVVWFETIDGRYFRAADVVADDVCDQPECPEPTPIPGKGDIYDDIDRSGDLDDSGDPTLTELRDLFATEAIVVETPDQPDRPDGGPNGDCCVSQLFDGRGVGERELLHPEWVTVASGPHGSDPAWYTTTDGAWFSETAVVEGDQCRRPTACPTGQDGSEDPDQKLYEDLLGMGETATAAIVAGSAADVLSGSPLIWCCVSGNLYDEADGEVRETIEPTRVLYFSSTDDGAWHSIVLDGAGRSGWVMTSQFLPAEDCRPGGGDGECPSFALIDVINLAAQSIDICCVTVQTATGAPGFEAVGLTGMTRVGESGIEHQTLDNVWIPASAFVGAESCEQVVECPNPDSIVNANDPLTCCISFPGIGFDILTLTGNVREGANGEPEYEATDGIWYQDFASAERCQLTPPAPDPTATPVPDPTPDPTPTPCLAGQVRNNAGQCVTPACPDADQDGVCDGDDNCINDRNQDQADADGDGQGNACDPCTDADQDLFCENPGDPNNDNCWGVFNPDQSDADQDRVGDSCDNCPNVPNSNQENTDGQGGGDACEPRCPREVTGAPGDADGDGICNNDDNCPRVANPNQEDTFGESGIGDACEERCGQGDDDGDGVCNGDDNCFDVPNPNQEDTFGEKGVGDACEERCGQGDDDADGVCNGEDNCFNVPNPGQRDTDGDFNGDACDFCPTVPSSTNIDSDGDGFGDDCDICPDPGGPVNAAGMANPDQGFLYDTNDDGVLDSCFAPLL
jgi:hypothetical protein